MRRDTQVLTLTRIRTMRFFRKQQADTASPMVNANPYETLVTGSPPDVDRGLYWDASRGLWRDRDREASERARVSSVAADARARQEARDAGETDGFRYGLPDYGEAANTP